MAELPRRVRDLARRFGIPKEITDRDEVIRQLQIDSERAAEEVRLTLRRFLQQLNSSSIGKPFTGYDAAKEELPEQRLVLPKSKIDISGKYKWQVYVTSPDPDFNLFDLLDAGRDPLPKRSKEQGPYPFWNIPDRYRGSTTYAGRSYRIGYAGQGRLVNGYKGRDTSGRFTVAPKGESSEFARDVIEKPKVFSFGPVRGVPAIKLYERALNAAKDRLAGTGFEEWDVIYVGSKR